MRIGSVFSGIGGLELGLERAGVGRTVWQCENEPYARAVLAKHWPGVPCFPDVRKLGRGTPPVDVVCAGFPCQDISNAGKRQGIRGERSGLFFELMRAVRVLRPRFLVLENVAALLNRGRGFDAVLTALAAGGYDAEWDCIPACAVGAPHLRDRLFIIGVRATATAERSGVERRLVADSPRDRQRGDQDDAHRSAQPDKLAVVERGRAVVADHARRLEGRTKQRTVRERTREGREPVPTVGFGRWMLPRAVGFVEPDVVRVVHGVPSRVDRLRCLGNSVVPQVAEVVGRRLVEIASGR